MTGILTSKHLDTGMCVDTCEGTGRRQPSPSQGEKPQKKLTLPTPWPDFSSPELWGCSFLLFKPPRVVLCWGSLSRSGHSDAQPYWPPLPDEPQGDTVDGWVLLSGASLEICTEGGWRGHLSSGATHLRCAHGKLKSSCFQGVSRPLFGGCSSC